jgi:glycosyltransferase involved in cell wall biosynthesis
MPELQGLRLGFHYHIPAVVRDGDICVPSHLGRFLDTLALHCRAITCFLPQPRPDEIHLLNYRLSASNVELVNIGPHASVPYQTFFSSRYTKCLKSRRNEIDAMFIRGPSPLLPAMANAAGNLPIILLLVGDYLAGIDTSPQHYWRRELIRVWARQYTRAQSEVAHRSLTLVNSHELYENMRSTVQNLFETRTTTLTESDFFIREDTCQSLPIHLLYTGRIAEQKGVLNMVDAVGDLVTQGEDLVLDLVGWTEKGEEQILDKIKVRAQQNNCSDRIIYHGYKAVGPELFAYYKQADIYLLASTFEGFPRTIWEAMACSLPVIATRVGSIPFYLTDMETVLLIHPQQVGELADAIRRLIHAPSLRQRLIRNAITLAHENTLEKQARELIAYIEQWVANSIKQRVY